MTTSVEPTRKTLERAIRGFIAVGSGLDPQWVFPRRDPTRQDPEAGQTLKAGPEPPYPQPFATAFVYLTETLGTTWTGPVLDDLPEDRPWTDAVLAPLKDSTMYRVYQDKRCVVSVQFYREGALDRAEAVELWAGGPLGRMEAQRRGLGFNRTSTVRNVTARFREGWEERSILDLHLEYTAQSIPQDMGRIDVAALELHHTNPYIGPIRIEADKDGQP